ncbi:hypothetical protein HDU67_008774 [Dinochytrium kinnereticum]|nr:hypothetical protein HDU67_008774 [Dinochytrium kinnereticum]
MIHTTSLVIVLGTLASICLVVALFVAFVKWRAREKRRAAKEGEGKVVVRRRPDSAGGKPTVQMRASWFGTQGRDGASSTIAPATMGGDEFLVAGIPVPSTPPTPAQMNNPPKKPPSSPKSPRTNPLLRLLTRTRPPRKSEDGILGTPLPTQHPSHDFITLEVRPPMPSRFVDTYPPRMVVKQRFRDSMSSREESSSGGTTAAVSCVSVSSAEGGMVKGCEKGEEIEMVEVVLGDANVGAQQVDEVVALYADGLNDVDETGEYSNDAVEADVDDAGKCRNDVVQLENMEKESGQQRALAATDKDAVKGAEQDGLTMDKPQIIRNERPPVKTPPIRVESRGISKNFASRDPLTAFDPTITNTSYRREVYTNNTASVIQIKDLDLGRQTVPTHVTESILATHKEEYRRLGPRLPSSEAPKVTQASDRSDHSPPSPKFSGSNPMASPIVPQNGILSWTASPPAFDGTPEALQYSLPQGVTTSCAVMPQNNIWANSAMLPYARSSPTLPQHNVLSWTAPPGGYEKAQRPNKLRTSPSVRRTDMLLGRLEILAAEAAAAAAAHTKMNPSNSAKPDQPNRNENSSPPRPRSRGASRSTERNSPPSKGAGGPASSNLATPMGSHAWADFDVDDRQASPTTPSSPTLGGIVRKNSWGSRQRNVGAGPSPPHVVEEKGRRPPGIVTAGVKAIVEPMDAFQTSPTGGFFQTGVGSSSPGRRVGGFEGSLTGFGRPTTRPPSPGGRPPSPGGSAGAFARPPSPGGYGAGSFSPRQLASPGVLGYMPPTPRMASAGMPFSPPVPLSPSYIMPMGRYQPNATLPYIPPPSPCQPTPPSVLPYTPPQPPPRRPPSPTVMSHSQPLKRSPSPLVYSPPQPTAQRPPSPTVLPYVPQPLRYGAPLAEGDESVDEWRGRVRGEEWSKGYDRGFWNGEERGDDD